MDGLLIDGRLRVWSVIVTIFGELARNPDDEISGALLSRLTELMGIRPEAMRVALHRLRKDGWIESRKIGRSSNYSLSLKSFEESTRARVRIYASKREIPIDWHILVAQPMSQADRAPSEGILLEQGYVAVSQGTYLGIGKPAKFDDYIILKGTISHVPDWLKNANAEPDIAKGYVDLEAALLTIANQSVQYSNLETAALRVLIVHNWRRLLLRQPDLPEHFFPDGWRENACRQLVAGLLKQLQEPDLALLRAGV